ncbi:hypothetical protein BP5796_09081 [Coleophoma crateriformis]|uniref:Uncharacterized protein n=1 Tax=Coleophoma crateriformis TaxID=565419 RepID=A0A3D8R3N2_9HELO|nr:hypothetical protein BP5796_09081 [Coleophoma crateriformis]
MSSQPSTVDTVKNTASSAYKTVANVVQPSQDSRPQGPELTKDAQGQACKKGDYKDQLNQATMNKQPQEKEGYIEKGVSKLQQLAFKQGPEATKPKDDGTPPTRPDHDTQVEEFIRSQYMTQGNDVEKLAANN